MHQKFGLQICCSCVQKEELDALDKLRPKHYFRDDDDEPPRAPDIDDYPWDSSYQIGMLNVFRLACLRGGRL